METDLSKAKADYDKILNQLSDPELISDSERMEELLRKKAWLEKIISKEEKIQELKERIEENNEIIKSGEEELSSLATTEISQLNEEILKTKDDLEKIKKAGSDSGRSQAVIMEIRGGTGGEEASLFAGDLFRMYSRFAKNIGWSCNILDSHPTEIGGFKEIVFELAPEKTEVTDIWSLMRYEAGVHRVQRIPETEKAGRVHTSTVTVAVLPKPKKSELNIRPDDLRIEFFRSSGAGGQNVNRRETAVRIIHIPSGIVVTSQTQRSQLDNRQNAMTILAARIIEKQQEEASTLLGTTRKDQVGTGDRSEKIRTYNFPQDRITDHRIKKNWHNIEGIMAGDLEEVFEDLKELNNP